MYCCCSNVKYCGRVEGMTAWIKNNLKGKKYIKGRGGIWPRCTIYTPELRFQTTLYKPGHFPRNWDGCSHWGSWPSRMVPGAAKLSQNVWPTNYANNLVVWVYGKKGLLGERDKNWLLVGYKLQIWMIIQCIIDDFLLNFYPHQFTSKWKFTLLEVYWI